MVIIMEKRFFEEEPLKGLLFLKTKMADCNIHTFCGNSKLQCGKIHIQQVDEIIDQSNRRDVDRNEIGDLMQLLETGKYEVLIVRDIWELTNDADDLEVRTNEILAMGIGIFELSSKIFRYNNYE